MTVTNNGIEKIIKGGKVKGKMSGRSYTAGTEYNWTITGQASSTNYIYSQNPSLSDHAQDTQKLLQNHNPLEQNLQNKLELFFQAQVD